MNPPDDRLVKKRKPGFRFSFVDGIAIVVCGAIVWLAYAELGKLAWLPAVVLGHFFLFCNVFRIHRNYELIWAGVFVVNFGIWFLFSPEAAPLEWILISQTPVTIFLILLAVRGPDYHGIFAKQNEVGPTRSEQPKS